MTIDDAARRGSSAPNHDVTVERDVRIPVRDGLRLSANLWLPVPRLGDPDERFPAILEMIPYRKDDWRANADDARGRFLAARGFAFCRLDVRGTGSSPGIAQDEYSEVETTDGCDAVKWLAAQPWSNGNVGMWGISYGGFTAIQVAALRPPHLRAIVPMYASDDRYVSDVHYVGGCPTASELTQYAVSMIGCNALPPRPSFRGDGWVDEWRERLERTPIWLVEWLRQQHDGAYWRRGSLAPGHDRINAAMLLIGGWMDSYVDPVFRMLDRCVNSPRRAIIGNWVHEFPDTAYPGPNLDWLDVFVRFFDHWLKGIDNGVMDEPRLVWFRREWAAPEPFPRSWPGTWQASSRPSGDGTRVLHLANGGVPLVGRLTDLTGPEGMDSFDHLPTVGTRSGLSWGAGGPPNGLARDLRPDESLVPTYTSDPLLQPVDVFGAPVAVLRWSSPVPVASAVVRLSDVGPDGTPTQVTAGVLNLTHRNGHSAPAPLEPGALGMVRVPLRSCGYRFRVGHRIRLSVASAAWPVIWPTPYPARFELHLGGEDGSRLLLPLAEAVEFDVPAFSAPAEQDNVDGGSEDEPVWRVVEDVPAGTVTVETFEGGETVTADGTRLYSSERHEMTASDADPSSARMSSAVVYRLHQDGHDVDVEADGEMSSTAADFRLRGELRVRLDGESFFERRWDETIPRDLV